MPCKQNRVYAAFFAPWLFSRTSSNLQDLAFDLVVLSQQEPAIAFRFEPSTPYQNGSHAYEHVQLNRLLVGGGTQLKHAVVPPTTYPAFPIPSNDPLTRFLAMVVTMHGFPRGIDNVLRDAFNGRATDVKKYMDLTSDSIRN